MVGGVHPGRNGKRTIVNYEDMSEKLAWLSFPLGISDPRPPAIPQPEISDLYTLEKDGANVQMLRLASHTGTHVDAPRHVIPNGVVLTEFQPEEFIFTQPAVIDLRVPDDFVITPQQLAPFETDLAKADLVLFRFGCGQVRSKEPKRFSAHCPGFGIQAGRWLRSHAPRLRAIGMDVPSVACIAHLAETMAVHHELLGGEGRRFLIIEDMNLDRDLAGLSEVRVSPWLVREMDSGPCSVTGGFQ